MEKVENAVAEEKEVSKQIKTSWGFTFLLIIGVAAVCYLLSLIPDPELTLSEEICCCISFWGILLLINKR